MCDTTFTFGQRGAHFLQCPSHKEITHLPNKLATLLSSARLQQIHHVTLGFEDSFLLTWRDLQGRDHINGSNLPSELIEFLDARDAHQRLLRNIAKLRCTLGPYNNSFLAHDGSDYRWMNLPAKLLSALQSRIDLGSWTDRPRIVTLGANDNFVLLTENHAAIWNLHNYKTGSNLLEYSNQSDQSVAEISNIVLHPYRYDGFITQSRNGTLIHNNLPPHTLPSVQAVIAPILQDTKSVEMRRRARRESEQRGELPRSSSNLQQRAQIRRDWGEHTWEFTAQSNGVGLSLRMSATGLSRFLG